MDRERAREGGREIIKQKVREARKREMMKENTRYEKVQRGKA